MSYYGTRSVEVPADPPVFVEFDGRQVETTAVFDALLIVDVDTNDDWHVSNIQIRAGTDDGATGWRDLPQDSPLFAQIERWAAQSDYVQDYVAERLWLDYPTRRYA